MTSNEKARDLIHDLLIWRMAAPPSPVAAVDDMGDDQIQVTFADGAVKIITVGEARP